MALVDEATIMRAVGHIDAAAEQLRRALEETRMTGDELELASTALSAIGALGPRSRRDALAWARAVKQGFECWLVVHVVPEDDGTRLELRYHGHLTKEQRAVIGR